MSITSAWERSNELLDGALEQMESSFARIRKALLKAIKEQRPIEAILGQMEETTLASMLELFPRAISSASPLLEEVGLSVPPVSRRAQLTFGMQARSALKEVMGKGSPINKALVGLIQEVASSPIRPDQVARAASELIEAPIAQAKTIANTTLAGLQRQTTTQAADALPGEAIYLYAGPDDSATRPFCKKLVGKAITEADLKKLKNGQGLPVKSYGGGYNCRHSLIPITMEYAAAAGIEGYGKLKVEKPEESSPPQFAQPTIPERARPTPASPPPKTSPFASKHDQRRTEFGFNDIDPRDIEARKAALRAHLGEQAYKEGERAIQGWSNSSNPFHGGTASKGRYVRFLSVESGMIDIDKEVELLKQFYDFKATDRAVQEFRDDYKQATTEGTKENQILKAVAGQQLIWADYMRAQGMTHITVYRGMTFPNNEYVDRLMEDPSLLKSSAAASFTADERVTVMFAGRVGGVVVEARVPIEQCLLGHHTHQDVGLQTSDTHEAEIVVGSLEGAEIKIRRM